MLTREKIIEILESTDPKVSEDLFAEARRIRQEHSGEKIFLYGFVYFTTWCRNNCAFCYFRKDNNIERYRKTKEEVLQISRALAADGVNLLDLTMGEDQYYHNEDFETVVEIIKDIKEELDIPVMISPGVVPDHIIDRLYDAGADFYALYQETHNRDVFSANRLCQSYDERMHAKLHARDKGMFIEEGLMSGIGESVEDIADSIIEMGRIGASQVRIMSFVPQAGSPMEDVLTPDRDRELKTIAIMRIMYPDALIPASLDVDGINGLEDRINAGANLVTSIIPPRTGLAGVANSSLDVDEGGRTVAEASEILRNMGLYPATKEEYKRYLEKIRWQK